MSSALILMLMAIFLHQTQLFSRADNLIYDVGQNLFHTAPPDDIVIVAIDEASLASVGRWPWSRDVHAKVLERLEPEQPAVIGFDIIFSEPDLNNPDSDAIFNQRIAESGRVVLPVLLETTRANGQIVETLPLPSLIESSADVGRVHAVLDMDSIARSVYLKEGLGEAVWQLFAQAIINVAENKPTQNTFRVRDSNENASNPFSLVRNGHRRVNFLGSANHFKSISYEQVLKGGFPKGTFSNKIVLIGATALGMNDLLTTPVSGGGQPMAGVEFHANVIESIRTQHFIQTISPRFSLFIVSLAVLLPLFWLPKLSALKGLLATLAYFVLIAILSGLMTKLGVWLPPSAALVPILLAFPIWSWRKLEASQLFLDDELKYLREHLASMPNIASGKRFAGYDEYQSRIAQVRKATEQLRFLQEDRQETLSFISHDLRAPIASALMVAESNKALSDKLQKPLSKALNLAEDFLQASRAENLDAKQFKELDFVGLMHESVDEAYEMASKKSINIVRGDFEGLIWVDGNFGLLQRALVNLLSNAVKYSHEDTEIRVALAVSRELQQLTFSVTNQGVGIAKEEQASLFKRFSRIKSQSHLSDGAGLGLYFVKTVVDKHKGEIAVESDVGQPTIFSVRLPIIGFDKA